MSLFECDYCGSNNIEPISFCTTCDFPLNGSKEKKFQYKMKAVDAEFWVRGILKVRQNYFIVGGLLLVSFLFFSVSDLMSPPQLAIIVSLGLIYMYLAFNARHTSLNLIAFGFVLYCFHSVIEIVFRFSPTSLLPEFPIRDGWYESGPIIVVIAPYVYIIFRILIFVLFLLGLMLAIKIWKNDKLVGYRVKAMEREVGDKYTGSVLNVFKKPKLNTED